MSAPAPTPQYIDRIDLDALFTAAEVDQLTSQGLDADRIIELTNAEVHRYIAPLIGKAILVEVPLSLKMKAADLARFYLYTDVVGEDSPVMLRWKAAVRSFERIAEGKESITLNLADDPATPTDETLEAGGTWSERGANRLDDNEFSARYW